MPTNAVTSPDLPVQRENILITENENETAFFKIHCVEEKDIPAFNTKFRSIKIEITRLPARENFVSNLKVRMEEVFDCLIDESDEKDLISFKIVTDNIEFVPADNVFKPVGKLDHTLLENLIQNMAHSKAFDVGDSFDICATRMGMNVEFSQISKCNRCESSPGCTDTLNEIKCPDCLLEFYGKKCFENHLENCGTRKKCSICKKTYCNPAGRTHSCYCNVCRGFCTGDHQCFMPRLASTCDENDIYKSAFLFYDFETTQEKILKSGKKLHEVNLCVAQLVCHRCFDSDLRDTCTFCSHGKTYVFREDPVKELLTFVLDSELPSGMKRLVCIAHNAKDYDAQFILKYLLERTDIDKPFLIVNGTSIVFMNLKNKQGLDVKFIDSISYFNMKLAKLPATFGFEDEYKKGWFPYLFNTTENQSYVGRLPDQKYYNLVNMSDKELSAFQEWHKKLLDQNYTFDFAKELVDYCRIDVEILRKACCAFRNLFVELGAIDPFVEAASMATVCSKIFRAKFLKPGTIGIIPFGGYRRRDRATRSSVEWLLVVEKEIGKELVHVARGSEHRVDEDIIVDGYIRKDDGSDHAYQFYECAWNGCPECFDGDRDEQIELFGDSYNERYDKTIAVGNAIKEKGYILTEMWECEFRQTRDEHKLYLFNHPLVMGDALNPRDAFYGGRIETYAAHREIVGDEKIHYIDVCSLYPWVNKYGKVPVGHPKVYFGSDCKLITGIDNDLTKVEGLVKCRVLAPRDLYHPVLPTHVNDRTVFSLCRLCSENSEKGDCNHEDVRDREFTGTWVSDELKKAVVMGYRITRIYEIWQYKVKQYNPQTKRGGVFTGYVNKFFGMKQSARGWPEDCTSPEARERYLDEFEEREGIRLTPEENPGLYFISKQASNSLWGKFGQREFGTTEVLRSPAKLRELGNSSERNLVDLQLTSDESGYCKWMTKDEYAKSSADRNIAIAVYTVAEARLKLYGYLERLGDRVLYCNTDSCVYVSSREKGQDEIETGGFLGDMTDELAEYGKGSYVREFVSCGSNLYSMVVVKPDGTEEIIRKGIPKNSVSRDAYSHENMKALAIGKKDIIRCSFDEIRRTKFHDVLTCERKKMTKTSFLKRRYPKVGESLPFGFKKSKID